MNQIKKTATRVKFSGMTFLHYDKCTEENHEPKEYLILNNVRYYKVKNQADIQDIPDEATQEITITLPTEDEIEALETDKQMMVGEDGELKQEVKQMIKFDPKYPGRKTKALYLNVKTGNYVTYVRALQLKLV